MPHLGAHFAAAAVIPSDASSAGDHGATHLQVARGTHPREIAGKGRHEDKGTANRWDH